MTERWILYSNKMPYTRSCSPIVMWSTRTLRYRALPAFSLIFGELVDEVALSTDDFVDTVGDLALIFVWIGLAIFVVSYIEVAALTISAERQIKRIRSKYVDSILRQEIGWHDKSSAGEIATRVSK